MVTHMMPYCGRLHWHRVTSAAILASALASNTTFMADAMYLPSVMSRMALAAFELAQGFVQTVSISSSPQGLPCECMYDQE